VRKNVRALDQAVEERATVVGGEVDPDAPLVAADLLDDEVPPGRSRHEPAGDEAPDRVAVERVLDLHDLGTPVSERGSGGGDEAPVRHLHDAHAVEHGRHAARH